MPTLPSGHDSGAHGQPLPGTADAHRDDAASGVDAGQEAAMLRLTQDQMLVNQALVEKVLACERDEIALRLSEQKLHDLLAHQHTIREDERKQISRRLHDSLAQNLLALRMDIVMLHRQTNARHHRLRDRIGAALDNVDVTLRSVKELLGELRPACLELGLLAPIDMELRKFSRASGIAYDLRACADLDALHLDHEAVLTLHRLLQEALNNVCRHSLASRVIVRLEACENGLTMTVADNGIGFDHTAPRKPTSFGLLDLVERVAAQRGHLFVSSTCGQGTEVRLHLPLTLTPVQENAELQHDSSSDNA